MPARTNGDGQGEPLRCIVVIANPQGLHMRPAARFAEVARAFESTVTVRINDKQANGKTWVDLLLLAAEPGAQVTLEVSGGDAPKALPALARILGAASVDDDADIPARGL